MNTEENVESKTMEEASTETNGEETKKDEKKKVIITFDMRMNDFRSALQISYDDDEFRQFMEHYGYIKPRIEEGLAVITKATDADKFKQDKKAEEHAAYREAGALQDKANTTYMICVNSARLAFRGNLEILELLGLIGRRKQSFGGWKAQVTRFFEKCLASEELQADLAKYNVALALLQKGQQELQEAVAARDRAKRIKADAEHATFLKGEAYKEAVAWMKDFYKIVELAYKKNPQLKEKVNIVVPYLS